MTSKNALLFGAAVATMLAAATQGAAATTPAHHHKRKAIHREAAAPAPSPEAAEVSELRSEVQQLKATVEAQAQAQAALQAQIAQQQSQVAQVAADNQSVEQRLDTVPQQVLAAVGELPKPKTDKAYYKGVSITFGGFAEAAGIYRSRDETADISSSLAKIPFASDPASHTNEFSGSARQSRYSALVEGDISSDTRAYFYGEFDFQGGAQTANSNESDSYNPRIRNLYGQLDLDHYGLSLLAGQNWSLVTLNSKGITPRNEAPPSTIDAQYVAGFMWARQPQLRLTWHSPDHVWWAAVSAENPQTTIGSASAASGVTISDNQAPTSGYFAGVTGVSATTTTTISGTTATSTTSTTLTTNPYSLNKYPDLVGKVAYEGVVLGDHSVHAEVFGIARDFYDVTLTTVATGNQAQILGLSPGAQSHDTWGASGGGSLAVGLIPKVLDAQLSIASGQGLGRYGSGQLSDVTASATGVLHPIPETLWLLGGTWHATPMFDVYAYSGSEQETSKEFRYSTLPGKVFGYGSGVVANNANCAIEGNNSSCSPENRAIQQSTIGFWQRLYTGAFGRVQWGLQYSYTERKTFADATAVGFAPKADDNMVFASFRYYPF